MRNVYPLPVGWKLQDSAQEPSGARDVVALDEEPERPGVWHAVTITREGLPGREEIAGSKALVYRGPV